MIRFLDRGARQRRPIKSRARRFEALEERIALSGTPTIDGVVISSTQWTPAYISYLQEHSLGTDGYAIPVGSSAQTTALPWNNIDQIKITFSEDVNVQAADMSLTGKNATSHAFSDFFYDPQSKIATWTLAAPLAKDRLLIDLDANGIDPVKNLAGDILDGEWTNNADTFPSAGNGEAGGDFEFLVNVLPGEVNATTQVTSLDYALTRSQEGKSTTSTGYNFKYDVNGSGLIETSDWQFVLGKLGNVLPTGNPAGVSDDAPTAKDFSPVSITNPAIDVPISLWNVFADNESGASGLTYSVTNNSAPSLFDSISINQSTGQLTVNAASGVSGRASVTVTATDSAGISTSSSASVDVNYVNQPPLIYCEAPQYQSGYTWLISGIVADDGDVEDLIVVFYGVFATRAAVYPDGSFEFAIILEGNPYGEEFAVTHDRQGLESNTYMIIVGFS